MEAKVILTKRERAERRERLGRNLRRLMAANALTQVQIAQLLGVKQQTVSAWIVGQRPIADDHRERLSKMFGWEERDFAQ